MANICINIDEIDDKIVEDKEEILEEEIAQEENLEEENTEEEIGEEIEYKNTKNNPTKINNIKKDKNEECQELNNIKYKTMLLNGKPFKDTKISNNLQNLEKFLEDDKNKNSNEPWCKLTKTMKLRKLVDYTNFYKQQNNLSEEEKKLLINFFSDCLDKKKLNKIKDVKYDKLTGNVTSIPALLYNKNQKHFTLKNLEKRVSTLKSLTPQSMQNKTRIITNIEQVNNL